MKYLKIVFLLLTGIGCTDDINREYFKEFPATISLSHEKIDTNPCLYAVGGMALLDSVLITIDVKADTFFQVFRLPKYDYLGGYVTRGSGPNEEIFIDPFIKTLPQNTFYYKTATAVKITCFDEETGSLKSISKINIPDMQLSADKHILDQMWHVFKINDSIIGSVNGSKKEYVGIDTKTAEVFDFGDNYPNVGKKIDREYQGILLAKATTVKPDESAFASVYDKFPIIRIYSIEGKVIKELWYENHQSFPEALISKDASKYSINEIMQNYRIIKSSNRYIYALYIGKKQGELDVGLNDFSDEIHVWDWNGHPSYKLILDEKIFSFDVDKNDRYIVCSSLNNLDGLYKYILPDLIAGK